MDVIVELVRQVQTSTTSDLDTNYKDVIERLVPLEESIAQLIQNDNFMKRNDKHLGAMNFLARMEEADREGKKWVKSKSPMSFQSAKKLEGSSVPNFLTDINGAKRRRNSTLQTEDIPTFIDPFIPGSNPSER